MDLITGETILLVAVTFTFFLLLVHRTLLSITRLSLVLDLLSLPQPLHFEEVSHDLIQSLLILLAFLVQTEAIDGRVPAALLALPLLS